jgi:hypothetical protein
MYEVLPEAIGLMTECPHCHQQTEVLLAVAETDDGESRKAMIWTTVGIVLLVVALVAAIFAVHLAKRLIEEQRARPHAELLLWGERIAVDRFAMH